jgi:hypothetical protein
MVGERTLIDAAATILPEYVAVKAEPRSDIVGAIVSKLFDGTWQIDLGDPRSKVWNAESQAYVPDIRTWGHYAQSG